MFGMSSEDFWENDPQLYWSYRTFYLKKNEIEHKQKMEYIKYDAWLKGNINYVAHSLSLSNAFSKSHKDFPKYDELFKEEKKINKKEDINIKIQQEFNAWARY